MSHSRVAYDRYRDLAKLVPLWPEELSANSISAREGLIAKLERVCANERALGIAGAHRYHPTRHQAIIDALNAERVQLAALIEKQMEIA